MTNAMSVFDGLAGAGLTAPLLIDEAEMIYSKFIPTINAIEKAFTGWDCCEYPTLVGAEYHCGVEYAVCDASDKYALIVLQPNGQVQFVNHKDCAFKGKLNVTIKTCRVYEDNYGPKRKREGITMGLSPSVLREQILAMLLHSSSGIKPMPELFNEQTTGKNANCKEDLIEFIRLFTATKINKSTSREKANTIYMAQTLYRDFGFTNLDKLYIVVCFGLRLMHTFPSDGVRTQIIGDFQQFCRRYSVSINGIRDFDDLRNLIVKLGGTIPSK